MKASFSLKALLLLICAIVSVCFGSCRRQKNAVVLSTHVFSGLEAVCSSNFKTIQCRTRLGAWRYLAATTIQRVAISTSHVCIVDSASKAMCWTIERGAIRGEPSEYNGVCGLAASSFAMCLISSDSTECFERTGFEPWRETVRAENACRFWEGRTSAALYGYRLYTESRDGVVYQHVLRNFAELSESHLARDDYEHELVASVGKDRNCVMHSATGQVLCWKCAGKLRCFGRIGWDQAQQLTVDTDFHFAEVQVPFGSRAFVNEFRSCVLVRNRLSCRTPSGDLPNVALYYERMMAPYVNAAAMVSDVTLHDNAICLVVGREVHCNGYRFDPQFPLTHDPFTEGWTTVLSW